MSSHPPALGLVFAAALLIETAVCQEPSPLPQREAEPAVDPTVKGETARDSEGTSFVQQFDDAVELYNVKFAEPGIEIIARLRQSGKLTDVQFDEQIEWTFFYLWHHEGRRARHGAAMMGPDYVQWHGFYELTRNFYTHFLPLAKELGEDPDVMLALAGKVSSDLQEVIRKRPQLFAKLIREFKDMPDHAVLRVVREVRDGNW